MLICYHKYARKVNLYFPYNASKGADSYGVLAEFSGARRLQAIALWSTSTSRKPAINAKVAGFSYPCEWVSGIISSLMT